MKIFASFIILGLLGAVAMGPSFGTGAELGSSVPNVSAEMPLAALMSLTDGHLQKMADSLKILAKTDEARSGEWAKVRDPLAQIAKLNVEAVNWFALPTGAYWTIDSGLASSSLSDRPYFSKALEGKTVIGDLVVSKATGKSVSVTNSELARA